MATDHETPPPVDTDDSQLLLAFRRGVTQAAESGDLDTVESLVESRASGCSREVAAGLWLSVAERWAVSSAAARTRALSRAAESAWGADGVFERIERSFEDSGDPEAMLAAAQTRAARDTDPDRRASALVRVAGMATRSGALITAIEAWTRLAESEPARGFEALEAIGRLEAGEPAAARRATERVARVVDDSRALLRALDAQFASESVRADEAVALLRELAPLALEATRDPEIALGYVADAWDRFPDLRGVALDVAVDVAERSKSDAAASEVVRYACALERWVAAAEWAERRMELAARPSQKAAIALEAADLRIDRVGEIGEGLRLLARAVELDDGVSPAVRNRLDALERGAGAAHRASIQAARERLLVAQMDWTALHDAVTQRVLNADGIAAQTAALIELAGLQEDRLNRPDLAAVSLSDVLEKADDEPTRAEAILRLRRLCDDASAAPRAAAALLAHAERTGDDRARLEALRVLAPTIDDSDRRRSAFVELGVLAVDFDEQDVAAQAFASARAIRPDADVSRRHRQALSALGRHSDVLHAVDEDRDHASDDELVMVERDRSLAWIGVGDEPSALLSLFLARRDLRSTVLDDLWSRLTASSSAVESAISAAARLHSSGDTAAGQGVLLDTLGVIDRSDSADAWRSLVIEAALYGPLPAGLHEEAFGELDSWPARMRIDYLERVLRQTNARSIAHPVRVALARLIAPDHIERARDLLTEVLAESANDAAANDAMVELANESGDPAWVAAALEDRLATTERDRMDATRDLESLTEIYASQLGRPDLSVDAARRLLTLTPDHVGAFEVIAAAAADTGDFRLEYEAAAATVEHLPPSDLHARRLARMGELANDAFSDADLALSHLFAAAALDGADDITRVSAARAAAEIGFAQSSAATVTAAFELEWPLLTDDDRAPRAEEVIDRLAEFSPTDALAAAAIAVTDADATGGVLDRHAQLARLHDRHEAALASLTRWSERDGDLLPLDRRALLATLSFASDGDSELTWTRIASVLVDEPDHPEVLALIEDPTVSDERRLVLAATLLESGESRDANDALPTLYRAAEIAFPVDAILAEDAWRGIVARDAGETRAFDALLTSIRARGDRDAEDALLRDRLDAVATEDETLTVLRALAAIATTDDEAEARLMAVLENDFADIAARVALAELYERTDRAARAVEILDEVVPLSDDPAERRDAHRWIARLALDVLGDRERAATALESAAKEPPMDRALLVELTALYREDGRWVDVASALERQVPFAEDDDDCVKLWEAIAQIREHKLDDPVGTINALEKIVAIERANLPVLEEIARLHESLEAWDPLVATLERIALAAPIAGLREELLLRAAPVLQDHLDRAGDALDMYAQYVESTDPEPQTLSRMKAAAAASGRWVVWANAMRAVARREVDDTAREQIELEIADALVEHVGDPLAALRWLAERFAASPELGARLDRMEAIAREHDLRPQLVDSYKLLATASAQDPDSLWHGLRSSADIAESVLGHPDVAFGIMARAAEDVRLRDRADTELRRLADAHQLWSAYRDHLSDRGDESSGSDEEIDVLVARAAVEQSSLDDWQAAFETLLSAFQIAPRDERVRVPLFALAEERQGWEFIARLLEMMQEGAVGDERVWFLGEIADIYADRLGKPAEAFGQQLRAWQVSPDDADTLARLTSRAEQADLRVDLLAAFEWHTRQTTDVEATASSIRRAAALAIELGLTERAHALYLRLASTLGDDRVEDAISEVAEAMSDATLHSQAIETARLIAASCADPAASSRAYVRASEVASSLGDVAATIAALRAAVDAAPSPSVVRPLLLSALESAEDWPGLADQLERQLADTEQASEAAAIASQLHALYRDRIGDSTRAATMARRAMELEPESAERRRVYVDQLVALERWPEVVDHHLATADALTDVTAANETRLLAATIVEEHLDDPRRAVRIADSVLAVTPEHRGALELRTRSLAALGRWKEHIEALLHLAQTSDPGEAAAVYAQAAEVYEYQLMTSEKAREMWSLAADVDPSFTRALVEQARLATEAGEIDEAVRLWGEAVERLRSDDRPQELSRALTYLAVLVGDAASSDHDPVLLLREAVVLDARNENARVALEQALVASGDPESILTLLQEEYEHAQTDVERASLMLRRAAVLFFDTDNEVDAVKAVQRAEELGAGSGVHALSGDIHLVAGRWSEAAAAYALALGDNDTVDAGSTLPPRALLPGESDRGADVSVVYLTRAAYANEAAGRAGDARELYESANIEDDAYGPAIVGLARLALRRGNPDGAEIYLSNYRATGPHGEELDAVVADLEASVG